MKPLITEERDSVTLQNLGRASLQIIHDIKNQLNGLKLYATFLRKRMEKSEQPPDQQETIAKLIAGLDRAASNLNVLVRYGRPLELHRQQVDVQKVMRGVLSNLSNGGNDSYSLPDCIAEGAPLVGQFDTGALTEALRSISLGALKNCQQQESLKVNLRSEQAIDQHTAVVEWAPVSFEGGDPFNSFNGSDAIRMSLAAKIVEAHGGSAEQDQAVLRIRLPINHCA